MDAFRLSVPPNFAETTLQGLDFADLPSLQARALELYTPLIGVFGLVVILFFLQTFGKKLCLNADIFVNYRRALLVFFGITSVSTLVGLGLFIQANALTRQGATSLVRNVPSKLVDRFLLLKNATQICPLQNVTGGTLSSLSSEVALMESYADAIVEGYDVYISFYDDLVLSNIIFLFIFWFGMLVHIVSSAFRLEMEDTRTLYVLMWGEALFGVSFISWTKEIFLFITIILTMALIVAARLIGVLGVLGCPTVGTLDNLLVQSNLLSAGSNSSSLRNFFDYFVYCSGDISFQEVSGLDLNASDGFFDNIYELGFQCQANNSELVCTNNTLPCGFYNNASSYPAGFEYICPCSDLIGDISTTLSDCTFTSNILEEAFEYYTCGQFIPGITLGYIALILVLVALTFMLVVFTILSGVFQKINNFNDF